MFRPRHLLLGLLASASFGCPGAQPPPPRTARAVADIDDDGVADADDACPGEPEDQDGDRDGDGCPEPDEHVEHVVDVPDRCPDELARVSDDGCPTDFDGDGLWDLADSCVREAGPPAYGGCPRETPAYLEGGRIHIRNEIRFRIEHANILPASYATLDDVARVLREHPEITRLRVEGHSVASRPYAARVLSRERALAVVDYLVRRGNIDEARLEGQGFEDSRPLVDPTGPDRLLNRRIEFHITEFHGQRVD